MRNHPHAVTASVVWKYSHDEVSHGIGKELHCIAITVAPEFKLPKPAVAGKDLRWGLCDAAYPFWGIQRQRKENEAWNFEIRPQDVTLVGACIVNTQHFDPAFEFSADAYTATVPIIVNTKPIRAGERVILKWDTKTPPTRQGKRVNTCVDEVGQHENAGCKRAKLFH